MGSNFGLVLLACITLIAAEPCPDGRLEPLSEDCSRFRSCKDGKWIELTCPPGRSVFDPTKKMCVSSNDYSCKEELSEVQNATCIEGTLYPSDGCKIYERCISGKRVIQKCGLLRIFSSVQLKCVFVWPWYKCKPNSNKLICSEGKTKAVDCSSYAKCVMGSWKQEKCNQGDVFDGKKCVKGAVCIIGSDFIRADNEVIENGTNTFATTEATITETVITYESTNIPTTEATTVSELATPIETTEVKIESTTETTSSVPMETTTRVPTTITKTTAPVPTTAAPQTKCIRGQRRPNTKSCSKYYHCNKNGDWVPHSCFWFWHFDSKTLKCRFWWAHCAHHN